MASPEGMNIKLDVEIAQEPSTEGIRGRQVANAGDTSVGDQCVMARGSKLFAVSCARKFRFYIYWPRIWWPGWPYKPYWHCWWGWRWCFRPWPYYWKRCCDNFQVTNCYKRNTLFLEDSLPITMSLADCQESCIAISECRVCSKVLQGSNI